MTIELPVKYSKTNPYKRRQVRLKYIKEQGGLCWYCNRDLTGDPAIGVLHKPIKEHLFPKGFFDNPVHLHHDHNTDLTVGAVHAKCNAVMWQYFGV